MIAGAVEMVVTENQEAERLFEEVALRETRRLFVMALAILRDRGEAEEAVQDTLVRAWRAWAALESAERPDRWLAKVCVNTCISRRRGLTRRGWFHQQELTASARSAGDDHHMLDVDRAYGRLSVRQRTALTLNYRYGYSVDECAEMMGCRPGTVRAHVARALESLRRELVDA